MTKNQKFLVSKNRFYSQKPIILIVILGLVVGVISIALLFGLSSLPLEFEDGVQVKYALLHPKGASKKDSLVNRIDAKDCHYRVVSEGGVAVRVSSDPNSEHLGFLKKGMLALLALDTVTLVAWSDGTSRTRVKMIEPFTGWVTFELENGNQLFEPVLNLPDEKKQVSYDKPRLTASEFCTAQNFMAGKDMKGGDMRAVPEQAISPEDCCKICFFEFECVGFTFVQPNSCWLKSLHAPISDAQELISGVIPEDRDKLSGKEIFFSDKKTEAVPMQAVVPIAPQATVEPIPCCSDDSKDSEQLDLGKKKSPLEMWYLSEATDWETMFPLGNGRVGALLGWDPVSDVIAISEETLYTTQSSDNKTPDKYEVFMKMRDLLRQKKFKEAEEAATDTDAREASNFQYAGELLYHLVGVERSKIQDYSRTLDIQRGVSSATFKALSGDGSASTHVHTREAFLSATDNVLALRMQCSPNPNRGGWMQKGCLNLEFLLRREGEVGEGPFRSHITFEKDAGFNVMRLQKKQTRPGEVLPFELCIGVTNSELGSERIIVKDRQETVVYVAVHSAYNNADPFSTCRTAVEWAWKLGYTGIKERHINLHQKLFDRVEFSLQSPGTNFNGQCNGWFTLDERVRRFDELCEQKENNGAVGPAVTDHALYTLMYQFGRYLLLCSSRSGTKPANLQGVWANSITSMWGADYHMNINLQMNYWGAQAANLPETVTAYTDFIQDLSISGGKTTAQAYYHCPGWVAHGFTDLWVQADLHGNIQWSLCPVCGVWSALALWEAYEYSQDMTFLSDKALPVLESAVEFFLCYCFEVSELGDTLFTGPSTSPENSFTVEKNAQDPGNQDPNQNKGDIFSLALSPALDTAVLFELFTVYLKMCQLLNSCKFTPQASDALSRLPNKGEPSVGTDGMIQEYIDVDFSRLPDPGHRHFSGLYTLYPGRQISVHGTPVLAEAAKKTLEYKLLHGGGHTNWSLAWAICLWARLGEREKAGESLKDLIQRYVRSNLLTVHPKLEQYRQDCTTCYTGIQTNDRKIKLRNLKKHGISPELNKFQTPSMDVFQIDANLGIVAAINEMLIQSHEERVISILPALPLEWENGHIHGVVVRGGHQIKLSWRINALVEFQIKFLFEINEPGLILRSKEKLRVQQNISESLKLVLSLPARKDSQKFQENELKILYAPANVWLSFFVSNDDTVM